MSDEAGGATGTATPPVPQSLDAAIAGAPPPAQNVPSDSPDLEPYSLDQTRKRIAYFLLWILVGIIAVQVAANTVLSARCWFDQTMCQSATTALGILNGSITPIFTAMVGLVGSVVGFYFGSKQT